MTAYLTEWKPRRSYYSDRNEVWELFDLNGKVVARTYCTGSGYRWYTTDAPFLHEDCPSMEKVMEDSGRALRQYGYEFISEERAEKLRLLS